MRALIVDDEAPLAASCVACSRPSPMSRSWAKPPTAARPWRRPPDLIFLDVQMPEVDGFDVAASLPDGGPALVFVTAFDQYAVRAFDAQAADYLLKPVEPERLARTVQRLRG